MDMPASLDPSLIARFAGIVGERYALTGEADVTPFVTERRGLFGGRAALWC